MAANKRKHQRVATLNLLSYVCMDEKGNKLDQGMGRGIDISQGGIRLETHVPITSHYILLVAIGVDDQLIKVKGEVMHCSGDDSGKYHTGVRFIETNEKIRRIVVNMIKVNNLQKRALHNGQNNQNIQGNSNSPKQT